MWFQNSLDSVYKDLYKSLSKLEARYGHLIESMEDNEILGHSYLADAKALKKEAEEVKKLYTKLEKILGQY